MRQLRPVCVLCTAAGGLGMLPVLKSLSNVNERTVRVICSDTKDDVLVSRWMEYRQLPRADSPGYIDAIEELCRKEKIDVILPGHTNELLPLAENSARIRAIGTAVAVSDYWSTQTAVYKDECYRFLAERGLGAPEFRVVSNLDQFREAVEALGYPKKAICFKPARYPNGGARGFRVLSAQVNRARLLFNERLGHPFASYDEILTTLREMDFFPTLLVSEYLPGEEYSVYVFCRNGEVLYCIPHLREELLLFYSFTASIVQHPEIEQLCRDIVRAFGFSHNINIQVKMSEENHPKVVEINPRMAGTIVLPIAAGFQFPYWSIKLCLGEQIPEGISIPYGLRMHRYWESIFTSPDDGKYRSTFP
jgi:carbamoyl-phosphate synthase large subunit